MNRAWLSGPKAGLSATARQPVLPETILPVASRWTQDAFYDAILRGRCSPSLRRRRRRLARGSCVSQPVPRRGWGWPPATRAAMRRPPRNVVTGGLWSICTLPPVAPRGPGQVPGGYERMAPALNTKLQVICHYILHAKLLLRSLIANCSASRKS